VLYWLMKYPIIVIILVIIVALSLLMLIFSLKKTPSPVKEEKVSEVVTKEPEKEKPKEAIKAEEEVVKVQEIKPEEARPPEAKTKIWEEINAKIDTGNPYRKQEAIEQLISIGDRPSIERIEELTQDNTPAVVNRALSALGELKSAESIPIIEEAFNENEIRQDGYGKSIRINAVNALGEIGSENSVDVLAAALAKKDVSFGSYVVDAMKKIGSKKSLPYLEEYKAFLDNQLENMPKDEEIGEYRYIWEQADKQVKEAIDQLNMQEV